MINACRIDAKIVSLAYPCSWAHRQVTSNVLSYAGLCRAFALSIGSSAKRPLNDTTQFCATRQPSEYHLTGTRILIDCATLEALGLQMNTCYVDGPGGLNGSLRIFL